MDRRTVIFSALLILIVLAIIWFMVGLPEVNRNRDALLATADQSRRLTEPAAMATFHFQLTQTANSP